jgi:hypothetical protein
MRTSTPILMGTVLVLVVLVACNSGATGTSSSEPLVGRWQLTAVMGWSEDTLNSSTDYPEHMVMLLQTMVGKLEYEFRKSDHFKATMNGEQTADGHWKRVSDTLLLHQPGDESADAIEQPNVVVHRTVEFPNADTLVLLYRQQVYNEGIRLWNVTQFRFARKGRSSEAGV